VPAVLAHVVPTRYYSLIVVLGRSCRALRAPWSVRQGGDEAALPTLLWQRSAT